MKKIFETPEIEVIVLDVEEILLASGDDYELGEDELPTF